MKSNMKEMVWVGGWASSLFCWKEQLHRISGGKNHRLIDVHDLISGKIDFGKILEGHSVSHVVAWSTGSLYVLDYLQRNDIFSDKIKWILVSPIHHFCVPKIGWRKSVLDKMMLNLSIDKKKVVGDFIAHALQNCTLNDENIERLLLQENSYTAESLISGLVYLRDTVVPLDFFSQENRAAALNVTLLIGINDVITPFNDGSWPGVWKREIHGGGHVPFFDGEIDWAKLWQTASQ